MKLSDAEKVEVYLRRLKDAIGVNDKAACENLMAEILRLMMNNEDVSTFAILKEKHF